MLKPEMQWLIRFLLTKVYEMDEFSLRHVLNLKRKICTLLFAADEVVLTKELDEASYMLRKLVKKYNRWGL